MLLAMRRESNHHHHHHQLHPQHLQNTSTSTSSSLQQAVSSGSEDFTFHLPHQQQIQYTIAPSTSSTSTQVTAEYHSHHHLTPLPPLRPPHSIVSSCGKSTGSGLDEYVDILQVQQLLLESSGTNQLQNPTQNISRPRPRVNLQKAVEYAGQIQGKLKLYSLIALQTIQFQND